jgi:hypothetical protein
LWGVLGASGGGRKGQGSDLVMEVPPYSTALHSGHDDPAFSAMANSWEQELSLQLCIIALMQKEELSDSRNRQAA